MGGLWWCGRRRGVRARDLADLFRCLSAGKMRKEM
jgi:hypothetical protein